MRQWWLSHPFRSDFEGVPMGWVLETAGAEIVGTFSNIHMMFELDGRRLKAGVAGSWGTDTEYRNSSLLLAMSHLNQKGVDLCINGSANEAASRIMTGIKVPRIPSPDFDLSYLWVTRRRSFAAAALRTKTKAGASLLAPLAAAGLWLADLKSLGRNRNLAHVERLHQFGNEFDVFWNKLRQEPGRLRAVRTPAALDWRFGAALRQNRLVILGHRHGGELQGYILLREYTRAHLGLRQFIISDLQALNDSSDVILDLLTAAREVSRQEGLDVVEWQGWNQAKRLQALSLRPKSYRYSVWPLYYKAVNRSLASALTQADTWDFSPFDAF